MASELSIDHFVDFFRALHGADKAPFPWQTRLLHEIVHAPDGRWPGLLDLPTGSGKTAAIDIAVFHLALEAAKPRSQIRAPRRIVLVVDRRTVVDQAFTRAKGIAEQLAKAKEGVLAVVRARLGALADDEDQPLAVAQLRGGMPRDDAWARSPVQPLVAVSTVDQVGSRLLFRGYGVSDTMRPIHAGLLGNDTLFLLDEVHLAQPFLQTLTALERYRGWRHGKDGAHHLPNRWQVVPMSATADTKGKRFTLSSEDREHSVLRRRLQASKPITCEEVKVSGAEGVRRRQFAEAIAKRAIEATTDGCAIGIVVNRVATALEIYNFVSDALSKKAPNAQVELATGRMRPLDRDALDKRLSERVASGRKRSPEEPPLIVVATQCIEAGADYDFDVLLTECASLDALRQRFGRLNRLGAVSNPTPAIVFARADEVTEKAVDPIYGVALKKTWAWISDLKPDFGIEALDMALAPLLRKKAENKGDELTPMLPPRPEAPKMFPAHLDAWTQTSQVPHPDPDISFWLHGKEQRADADVQIVWRADIEAPLAHFASKGTSRELESLRTRVELCPPSSLEALSVPIAAARAWLVGPHSPSARTSAADFGDVDGVPTESDPDDKDEVSDCGRPAFYWKGEDSDLVYAQDLRPGMTLIVPSSYGGLLKGTWDPSATDVVADLGDQARWTQTRRPVLRLHPAVRAFWPFAIEPPPTPTLEESSIGEERGAIGEWLAQTPSGKETWLEEVLSALKKQKGKRRWALIRVLTPETSPEVVGYFGLVGRKTLKDAGDATTENEASSMTGVKVSLTRHMEGVARIARKFGESCGLEDRFVHALDIAGRWHDAGKVDPRFQRWLQGGSPLAIVSDEPLAKSEQVYADRAARRRARERSGYPSGGRHELASLALLEHPEGERLLESVHAEDRDLVLHLVASHHGWCRPFAPVVADPQPVKLTLDANGQRLTVSSNHGYAVLGSGVTDRFWALTEEHGWFGLAWLETLLRLADHRRSAQEQSGTTDEDEDEDEGKVEE